MEPGTRPGAKQGVCWNSVHSRCELAVSGIFGLQQSVNIPVVFLCFWYRVGYFSEAASPHPRAISCSDGALPALTVVHYIFGNSNIRLLPFIRQGPQPSRAPPSVADTSPSQAKPHGGGMSSLNCDFLSELSPSSHLNFGVLLT